MQRRMRAAERICQPQAVVPVNPALLQREGSLDGGIQLRVVKRLFEEIQGLRPERGARGWHVAMRRDDDERQRCAALSQCSLQLDAALSRQSHVGDHATRPIFLPGGEKSLGVGEYRGAIAGQPEHERDGVAHGGIIVDDEDGQAL